MPEMMQPTDVVVVGLGAAGGTAVYLTQAGMKVVAIEAGPRLKVSDYPFDEITAAIGNEYGRYKSNWEVPTTRPTRASRPPGRSARPAR